jgi:peptide/nickel transport system permease protein
MIDAGASVRALLPGSPRVRSRWRVFGVIRRYPAGAIAAVVIVAHVVLLLTAGVIDHYSPTAFVANPFQPPSWQHPFGTDQLGRDVLSRTLHGGQAALSTALLGAALGVLVAALLAALVVLAGGWLDRLVGSLTSAVLSIPAIITLLVVASEAGTSRLVLIVVLAVIFGVPSFRVTRAEALRLRGQDYVLAARARGESPLWIALHELAPGLRGVVLVELAVRTSTAVILLATLSFLGLGVSPPTPDWGLMVAENIPYITIAWWATLAPILALGSLVLAINVLADALARALGVDRQGWRTR